MSVKTAVESYESGKYIESIEEFVKVLRHQRNNKDWGEIPLYSNGARVLWSNLGNAYTQLKEYYKAEQSYINALKCENIVNPPKDKGMVCFNYAYMLFFFKFRDEGDLKDLLKSYLLFKSAHSYGIENKYWKSLENYLFRKDLILTIIPRLLEDKLWLKILKNKLLRDVTFQWTGLASS